MPTVHRIGSIKIDVYGRDHLPPHFHAIYGDDRALIEIKTLQVYAGSIPPTSLKKVIDWASGAGIQDILMNTFAQLNPRFFNQ